MKYANMRSCVFLSAQCRAHNSHYILNIGMTWLSDFGVRKFGKPWLKLENISVTQTQWSIQHDNTVINCLYHRVLTIILVIICLTQSDLLHHQVCLCVSDYVWLTVALYQPGVISITLWSSSCDISKRDWVTIYRSDLVAHCSQLQ